MSYYSQFYEDKNYLVPIFSEIGVTNSYAFEVGAMDGRRFSNIRHFLDEGWKGLFIECNDVYYEKCVENIKEYLGLVRCVKCAVDTKLNSLDRLLEMANFPTDLDLGSIDIDGQDYHVFNAMEKFRPRVLVLEYNPSAQDDFIPPLEGQGQAGMGATKKLMEQKGYKCIVANKVNLIAVRGDIQMRNEMVFHVNP